MKKWKSFLSAVLAGIMILSAASGIFAAPTFTDVSNHWAWTRGYIPYLVEKNVLNGYALSNGTSVFKPEDKVTRAEFIKMLDETFGLVDKADVSYTDVKTTDWHHPYFAKAIAQGYILYYGNSVNPDGALTREEAITLLVRYLDLADAEKASVNTFADYYSINANYRDAVLAAVKAGLVEGYNEGGNYYFKPQNTLTRAEALTILYRAAGAIYNTSVYVKDSGAADTNAVITRGGVVLTGLTLNGRVIITEGVSGDSVVLEKTTVTDTLYVRGNSNVIISGKSVKNLIVDSKTSGIMITLSDGATVENLTLNSTAKVTISSKSAVAHLTANAKNVSITGDGKISTITVEAAGLVSSITPENYNIAKGLVATLGGVPCEGSSDNLDAFIFAPYLTNEEGHYYLNISPTVNGQIHFYFTNESSTPSVKEFDNLYLSANNRDYFSVSANKIYCESVGLTYQVEKYKYLVIQLTTADRNYAPILIENEVTSGTGFYSDPELTDDDTITFTTEYSGKVYYYYTDSMDNMSTAQFHTGYKNSDSALKGSVSVTANRSGRITLNSRYLEKNPFVVVILENTNGLYFTPVVVSAGDNGFEQEPKIATIGTITCKTKIDGTLYYYYSVSERVPSAGSYIESWRSGSGHAQVAVKKNTTTTIEYNSNMLASHPYLIFSIKDENGNFTKPFVLHVENTSGFKVDPYVSGSNKVSFQTTANGTVYWYMSNSEKAPTSIADFTNAYNIANNRRGSVSVAASTLESFTYPTAMVAAYPYLVIHLRSSNGTEYLPVVLSIKDNTETGFAVEPYANTENSTVYFKAKAAGTVYYYFAKKTTANVDYTQNFAQRYEQTASAYKGYTPVAATVDSISYASIDLDKYNVMVLCFKNDSGEECVPVAVTLNKLGSEDVSSYGLQVISIDENSIKILVEDSGILYYAGQLTDSVPNNTFIYGASSKSVTADSYVTIPIAKDFNYMALKLSGYTTIVVNTFKKTEGGDSTGGATTRDTGFVSCKIAFDANNYPVFTFTPKASGTVSISASSSGPSKKEVSVVANETYTVTFEYRINDLIDAGLGSLLGDFTYYVQLTTDTTVYERVSFPVN